MSQENRNLSFPIGPDGFLRTPQDFQPPSDPLRIEHVGVPDASAAKPFHSELVVADDVPESTFDALFHGLRLRLQYRTFIKDLKTQTTHHLLESGQHLLTSPQGNMAVLFTLLKKAKPELHLESLFEEERNTPYGVILLQAKGPIDSRSYGRVRRDFSILADYQRLKEYKILQAISLLEQRLVGLQSANQAIDSPLFIPDWLRKAEVGLILANDIVLPNLKNLYPLFLEKQRSILWAAPGKAVIIRGNLGPSAQQYPLVQKSIACLQLPLLAELHRSLENLPFPLNQKTYDDLVKRYGNLG